MSGVSELLKYMQEKNALLEKMLKITKAAKIKGNPQDAENEGEAYVSLMDRRKAFMEKLDAFDKLIEQNGGLYAFKNSQIDEEIQKMKNTARLILEEDKRIIKIAQEISLKIKSSIKQMNVRKNLNNIYQGAEYVESALLDRKK